MVGNRKDNEAIKFGSKKLGGKIEEQTLDKQANITYNRYTTRKLNMTIEQWWNGLIDPTNLITETIYNITFEVIATWIFVRWSLNKIVKKIIEEETRKDSESL